MARRLTTLLLLVRDPARAGGGRVRLGRRLRRPPGRQRRRLGLGLRLGLRLRSVRLGVRQRSGTGSRSRTSHDRPGPATRSWRPGVAEYSDYVSEQVDETIAATTTFTDAVRAGDLAGGAGGLRPEPRGLGADRADRRPHRGDRRRRGRPRRRLRGPERPDVDRLAPPRVPPLEAEHHPGRGALRQQARPGPPDAEDRARDAGDPARGGGPRRVGAHPGGLQGKITGEEDRYSKTDLWDFAANVEGAEEVIADARPRRSSKADPELLARIQVRLRRARRRPRAAAKDGDG